MTDEARMMDDGCTNEAAEPGLFLTEMEIRELLETIEADDALVQQDRSVGSDPSMLDDWPLYLRLRTMFPKDR